MGIAKYQSIKLRREIIDLLKRCQRPGEPLSDTLEHLLDPMRIYERDKERRESESEHRKAPGHPL